MSLIVPESELPTSLSAEQAVEAAYAVDLATAAAHLRNGMSCLIECDKELAPFLYVNLRARLKPMNVKFDVVDGHAKGDAPVQSLATTLLSQLREFVFGAVDSRVLVLRHLDLLTTSSGGLTSEAREAIQLLYENPAIVVLGFKDPSFPLPRVIESFFPKRLTILGVARDRLQHLVTQRDSRKFGRPFQPWRLYKYVSGLNAVRLRRLLSALDGEDYPADAAPVYRSLRDATLTGTLEIPNVDLDRDIGGYARIKQRFRSDILDLLAARDAATNSEDVARLDELIPRGFILWGPPGTGKTYFAKAFASAIGAAIQIVSGPELKSKWVGESEENLRRIFHQARRSTPSIIVFDELDSFATARGTYAGSGVEHSMVNQLLTEMDGFHRDELVFIVGTTNLVESLDPALLRPGRFEVQMHIPYPDADDRREIVRVCDRKLNLRLTPEAVECAVRRTGDFLPGQHGGRYSGDHIDALTRAIARLKLRDCDTGETMPARVEQALTEWSDRPSLTAHEERVLATHEAGHAVVSFFCKHAPPVDRITIASEMSWAFGYVKYSDPAHRYIQSVGYWKDLVCVALGAREAERVLLEDLSLGCMADLDAATQIARELVESHGLADGVNYRDSHGNRRHDLATGTLERLDEMITGVLETERKRAVAIISENKAMVAALRDLLLEKKTLDRDSLAPLLKKAM